MMPRKLRAVATGMFIAIAPCAAPGAEPTPPEIAIVHSPAAAAEIMTDAAGRTVYVQEADDCAGPCDAHWQPVRAGLLALAHGPWSIVRRPDGTRQWAHDGRPLYTFAAEGAGQIRGETAGSGWKVVRLHRAFVPQDVSLWSDSKGQVLLVHKGRTLYLGELQGDTPSDRGADIFAESPPLDPARCTAGCRADWMPLTAPAGAAPAGDWSLVRSVTGEALWAYKGHVLYGYSGDLALGDRRGHARRIYLDETNAIFWRVATP